MSGRRLSRGVLAAAVSAAAAAVGAGIGPRPAGADSMGGGTAPSTIYAGVSVYSGSWRGSGSSCRWQPYLGDTSLDHQQGNQPVYKWVSGVKYQLYVKTCPGQADVLVWIPVVDPKVLSWNATAYLEDLLPDPVPGFAPPATDGVVKVATWFWTSRSVWASKSVTAWVPTPTGTLWATTTARPVALVFHPGDGSLGDGDVRCTGPGTPWTSSSGDTTPAPGGCEYTYRHSSAVAPNASTFPGRMTIVWDVSWRSSTGAGGYSGQLFTSRGVAMTVREIQALVVP